MAENHPAQRAEQKTDAKGGKGGEGAHRRIDLREKLTVKNQRGGNAVEQKIVPVDYRTGKTAEAARRARCSDGIAPSGDEEARVVSIVILSDVIFYRY